MCDSSTPRPPIQGAAPLARIRTLLARLHDDGTARDRAGNRQLFYDQYVGLLLLYFFNPTLTSLNALRQATDLDSVQRWLGLPKRVSIGSLSEAAGVFDPDLLRGLLVELAGQVAPTATPDDRDALRHLTAVDGTLLPVLPRLAHTLWGDAGRRSAKLHLHFEVGRGIPVDATVTPAASSEIAQLRGALQANRLYVTDRGYASYRLLADILAAGSSFVARLRGDAVFRGTEQAVPAVARAAGVVRDVTVDRLGVGADVLGRAVRVVVVQPEGGDGRSDTPLVLVSDRLDLPAEVVAQAYRWRWQIELFFRWLKCVLGCRHLLSHDVDGITIQIYVALIASVLLGAAGGRTPTKRTYEMFCHFVSGWATAEEMQRHLDGLKTKRAPPRKS
jgi:hypothetical protein